MVLHALTSLTYVVVAVARRLGYIGFGRCFWSADGPDLHPIGWGNVVFRHFNPHRWTGPDDPRAHLSLGPEGRARASRIGRGLSFASVHRRKSNFQIRDICDFICKPIYGDIVAWDAHVAYD